MTLRAYRQIPKGITEKGGIVRIPSDAVYVNRNALREKPGQTGFRKPTRG